VNDREILAKVISTPFFSSFIGKCVEGDIYAREHAIRSQAVGYWMLNSLTRFTGQDSREYIGIQLPGEFYDPLGFGKALKPHIEIPESILKKSDANFLDKLTLLGSGLHFKWWILPEVLSIRRALFRESSGTVLYFIKAVEPSRDDLVNTIRSQQDKLRDNWGYIAEEIAIKSKDFALEVFGVINSNEISTYLPIDISQNLKIRLEKKVDGEDITKTARRVNAWVIEGASFKCAAITPRLTYGSIFKDEVFSLEKESIAALLVRGLVINRVSKRFNLGEEKVLIQPTALSTHLRAIPAKIGQKIPEASFTRAIRFVTDYQEPAIAWSRLEEWARESYILTISKEVFYKSFLEIAKRIDKMEELDQDDVNNVLPLAWSKSGKITRVSYSRN
jgi:hypothetical protein